MLKLIGAILLTAAAGSVGINSAMRLKTRVRNLGLIVSALGLMKSEICDRLTPMPSLLEKLAEELPSPINGFFKTCLHGLENLGTSSFSMIWRKSLENSPELTLREAEIQTLIDMGQILGRYDTEEQKSGISYAIRRMEVFLQGAEVERDKQSKLYTVLGICTGLFLTILLM